jgi:hypothetical protein
MLNILKRFKQPEEVVDDVAAIEWAHQNESTPDMWKLEQFIRQAIFVPCDMKKGGVNHHLIEEAINGPVYEDTYTADEYTFWKKDLGGHSFPIVLPKDYRPDAHTIVPVESAPIKGELYYIRPTQFAKLDTHRGTGRFFRERVKIRIPYRTVSYGPKKVLPEISNHSYFTTITAWMYMGVQQYWDPMIGGIFKSQMDLYEHDQPRVWIKQYYKFETG